MQSDLKEMIVNIMGLLVIKKQEKVSVARQKFMAQRAISNSPSRERINLTKKEQREEQRKRWRN